MSKLTKTVAAQKPLVAEFTFNYDDTMVNTSGSEVSFGAVGTPAFDIIGLPMNAVVIGGEVVVETAYVGPTVATVSLGDSASTTRYASAVDLKTAARTGLTLSGYRNTSSYPVRATFNITAAAATAGKVTIRVEYVVKDRAEERM